MGKKSITTCTWFYLSFRCSRFQSEIKRLKISSPVRVCQNCHYNLQHERSSEDGPRNCWRFSQLTGDHGLETPLPASPVTARSSEGTETVSVYTPLHTARLKCGTQREHWLNGCQVQSWGRHCRWAAQEYQVVPRSNISISDSPLTVAVSKRKSSRVNCSFLASHFCRATHPQLEKSTTTKKKGF